MGLLFAGSCCGQLSFTFVPWHLCGHRSVQTIAGLRVGDASSVKTLVWQPPGLLDLLCCPCYSSTQILCLLNRLVCDVYFSTGFIIEVIDVILIPKYPRSFLTANVESWEIVKIIAVWYYLAEVLSDSQSTTYIAICSAIGGSCDPAIPLATDARFLPSFCHEPGNETSYQVVPTQVYHICYSQPMTHSTSICCVFVASEEMWQLV